MIKSAGTLVNFSSKVLMIALFILLGTTKVFSENEPNNSRETANPLALNSSISGSFTQADNSADFYKITTTADGKLVITVSSDAALCVSMTVVSENGTINLYYNGVCGSSHSNTITINNLATGIYYIWASNTGFGNYSISASFAATSLPNDLEVNDSRETALNLPMNSSVTGHLGYKNILADQIDYYKFTTAADGKLTLTVSSDQSLCIDLTIVSFDGTFNLYANGTCSNSSHSNTLTVNNLAAGTYYVSASAAGTGYGQYTLSGKLDVATMPNDVEPNNSRETAVGFTSNGNITGHLGYKNIIIDDKDYFKIVTAGNTNLTVSVTSDPTLCVSLTLVSGDGSINLLSNGSCGNSSYSDKMTKNALPPGTYYILATPSGYGSYKITTSFTYITGIDEPFENELILFPNPASEKLYINGLGIENSLFRIFDTDGKTVKTNEFKSSNLQFGIDISGLNSGIYFFELTGKEKILTKKFVKY